MKSKKLFDSVPCPSGCSECCGPFFISPKEMSAITDYIGQQGRTMPEVMDGWNVPSTTTFNCAFLLEGRCSIYLVRPLICRAMGAVDYRSLICSHNARAKRLMPYSQFQKLLFKAGYK